MRIYRVTLTAVDVPDFDSHYVPADAPPLDIMEFTLDAEPTSETIFSVLMQHAAEQPEISPLLSNSDADFRDRD